MICDFPLFCYVDVEERHASSFVWANTLLLPRRDWQVAQELTYSITMLIQRTVQFSLTLRKTCLMHSKKLFVFSVCIYIFSFSRMNVSWALYRGVISPQNFPRAVDIYFHILLCCCLISTSSSHQFAWVSCKLQTRNIIWSHLQLSFRPAWTISTLTPMAVKYHISQFDKMKANQWKVSQ